MRPLSGDLRNELEQERLTVVHLLEVDFEPIVRLTDGPVDIAWDGRTWTASQFLSFSSIAETADLLANVCTVGLSGVDQSVLAILLQERYLRRRAKIYLAALDGSLQVVGDAALMLDGRMDRPVLNVDPDAGTVTAAVDVVSIWSDLNRKNGRHTNDTEQRLRYPGDRGFEAVVSLPTELFWGLDQKLGPNSGRKANRLRPGP